VHRLSSLPETCGLRAVWRRSASPISSRGDMQVRCARRPATSQPADRRPTGLQVPLLLDVSRPHAGDRAIPPLSDSWKWAPFIPQDTHSFTAHPNRCCGRTLQPFPHTTHSLFPARIRSSCHRDGRRAVCQLRVHGQPPTVFGASHTPRDGDPRRGHLRMHCLATDRMPTPQKASVTPVTFGAIRRAAAAGLIPDT
jgi:hypothetical protein